MKKTDIEQCEYYGLYDRMTKEPPFFESCGRLDEGARPDTDRFSRLSIWDDHAQENILQLSIMAGVFLRQNQLYILVEMYRREEYTQYCGWVWDYHSATVRLLESLMKYGLVGYKQRFPRPPVYELTPFGKDYCRANGLR